MKYRKKPIVIEAFQWTANIEQKEDPEWIVDEISRGKVWFDRPFTAPITMKIQTLEGVMTAQIGDYIIKGVKGEIYPCKPGNIKKHDKGEKE